MRNNLPMETVMVEDVTMVLPEDHTGPRPKTATARVSRFESRLALAAARDDAVKSRMGREDGIWSRRWKGDFDEDFKAGRGKAETAEKIGAAVAKMSATATMAPAWEMAPAGAYPVVPAAIGGDPFSMKSRTQRASEQAPIRVWFPVSSSCAVSADDFVEILAPVVAAMKAVAEVRSVELIAYAGLHCYGVKHDAWFATFPVDVEFGDLRSLALLAEVSIGRSIMFSVLESFGNWNGGWPWSRNPHDPGTLRMAREALSVEEQDVFIPPAFGKQAAAKVREQLLAAAAACGVEITMVQQ